MYLACVRAEDNDDDDDESVGTVDKDFGASREASRTGKIIYCEKKKIK